MSAPAQMTCPRAGCHLPRWTRRDERGRKRLTRWCSAWCRHWDTAARNALLNGDERQAATLMEAAKILDRRTSGGDPVHGVQVVDATRWVAHKDTAASEIRHRRKVA